MRDIEMCRTDALGGNLYRCDDCDLYRYSYHSCGNRHCPKCGHQQAESWLAQQCNLILPVTHFMVTFTLHDNLRMLARSNQKVIYNLFFRTAAEALQELAWDERHIGGRLGMIAILQTWTRDLRYHPHIHFNVTGGGLSKSGQEWCDTKYENFLVPVRALSVIFRAKFRDGLKKTDLFDKLPAETWKQKWVVHCQPVGSGRPAFKYLAPYVFRVAISNRRILKLEDGKVTFEYKDADRGRYRAVTLPAEEFIHRFLQHVLPHRFIKVRSYGLYNARQRERLQAAQQLLQPRAKHEAAAQENEAQSDGCEPQERAVRCPQCGKKMHWVKELLPAYRVADANNKPGSPAVAIRAP